MTVFIFYFHTGNLKTVQKSSFPHCELCSLEILGDKKYTVEIPIGFYKEISGKFYLDVEGLKTGRMQTKQNVL